MTINALEHEGATSNHRAIRIDGLAVAAKVRDSVKGRVIGLLSHQQIKLHLAVVLVGDQPASQVYVRNKIKYAHDVGIGSIEHRLPGSTSEKHLLYLIEKLNKDPKVDGILVQLPLPTHIGVETIVDAIDPSKDVDGFHPVNAGKMATGGTGLVPCTPLGCLMLIQATQRNLVGLDAVVVGRSNIVGKPMANLLLRESCTVTIAHSQSKNLSEICGRADILIAAVGRPEIIRGSWVKKGSTVIDVGINRIETDGGKSILVGDVAYDEAALNAAAITPVPGGVGPMTIACLLQNTLNAAIRRRGLTEHSLNNGRGQLLEIGTTQRARQRLSIVFQLVFSIRADPLAA